MKALLASIALTLGFSTALAAAAPDDSIEIAFDRYKGKLHAAYSRALREQPQLKGRVDVEFTVTKAGKGSGCRVVLSTLDSPPLENELCAIVEAMDFGPRAAPYTRVKRIDFFPVN